jgi:hypothetical protein
MTLDEFELGKAWLGQFSFLDQEIGRQMLRSLRLVSHREFETGISHEVTGLLNDLNGENVALFGVEETPPEEGVALAGEDEIVPRRVAGSSADRVRSMNENSFRVYGMRVLAHPTLHSMRSQRIKNVVLIDDLIGSGKRISTYLRKEMEPTLKSWISFKWTKLWIVAYAGLDVGVQAVLRNGYGLTKDRIRLVTPPQHQSQYLTLPMQEFCKRNAKLTGHRRMPMGFCDGGVAMIFEHSCPNNAPAILWSRGRKFNPLFPNRGIPPELITAFYEENVNRPAQILWDSSQYRLALAMLHEPNLVRHQGSQWRLLLMLGLASRSRWEDVRIAGVLGIPSAEVESNRVVAHRIGLVDDRTRELTPLGRALLEKIRASAAKTQKTRKRRRLSAEAAYYPLSCGGLVRY